MARRIGPKRKYERRFGLAEREKKKGIAPRGKAAKRKKAKSEYGAQLEEKQKLKFIYGILERQLRRYIRESLKPGKIPTEHLPQLLETRLDNIAYRLGFAKTRAQARQFASHGHLIVNGKKINIPSYNAKPDDVILLKQEIYRKFAFNAEIPQWLECSGNIGRVLRLPKGNELPKDVKIEFVIEFYRKA